MQRIIVTGCGTEVGKTVVAAILTVCVGGDYWKPIECGEEIESDTAVMKKLLDLSKHTVHAPAYSFQAPLSPHHAARLENRAIALSSIIVPETQRPLIIETAGGIFVPLTTQSMNIDLCASWAGLWVVVSRHYLGSINHTLLTVHALKERGVSIAGIVFNGEPNPDSEAAILEISQVPYLGRVLPLPYINHETIERLAQQWSGIPLL